MDDVDRPEDLLKQIRETRRDRHPRAKGMDRLAIIEMAALSWGFGAAGLWLLVQGRPLSGAALVLVARFGPGAIGLLVALLVAGSLRSGLHGGPLAPERADVLNLLLAPVDRALVLRPVALRALLVSAGAGAVLGATMAAVSQSRLGGNPAAWALAGAAAGALAGLLTTAPAMLASGRHLDRRLATAVALLLAAGAVADLAVGTAFSPAAWVGAIALWPLHPGWLGLAAVPVVLALAGLALISAPGCSVEALERRAGLIELLRFVASMLDVRGFMRTRALLAQESPRSRPWLRIAAWRSGGDWMAVWQRHWRSLLRWPAWRLGRVLLLALAAGGAFLLTWTGASYMLLVAGFLAYMTGLEILEAWWQAVERPGLTDLLPTTRRALLVRHLGAAAVTTALAGLLPLVAVAVWLRPPGLVIGAAALGLVPLAIAIALGSALRGRDDITTIEIVAQQVVAPTQAVLDLPIVGALRIFRIAIPPAIVTAGFAPLLVAHSALAAGGDPIGAELDAALLVVAAVLLVVAGLRALPFFTLERT